jgi:hypothetical protein
MAQSHAGQKQRDCSGANRMTAIFDSQSRIKFSENYPEIPHLLSHNLGEHPLMALEALATMAEKLPAKSVEYNRGDLPIGIDPALVPSNGMTIGDTIRQVEKSGSWAVLKNIEQIPEYYALLIGLLNELKPQIEAKTGKMLRPQGFVFVSSPGAVTPYHFDPEHNILMQLRGDKVMTQFPAGDTFYAPDIAHERYHVGGPRNIEWRDEMACGGTPWHLAPGAALFVPVMAPHHVKNGMEPSISLSITWRSEWSFAEADARALNGFLRNFGFKTRPPSRFPKRNLVKSYTYRTLAKLHLVDRG